MTSTDFKKMAGTSAVFLSVTYDKASPVERDGMIWSAEELHLDELPTQRRKMPSLANVLALEGLEDYDPAEDGDIRKVDSVDVSFIYFKKIQSWIHLDIKS